MVTTADVRVVTARHLPPSNRSIVCVEPPPDVAKALQASLGGGAAVDASGIGNGSIQVDYNTSEALAELAGRVPGLLALRDGLFRACEAYANGSIGDAAYAMILSRYGDLLTTVILADAMHSSQASRAATAPTKNFPANHAPPAQKPADAVDPKGSVGAHGAVADEELIKAVRFEPIPTAVNGMATELVVDAAPLPGADTSEPNKPVGSEKTQTQAVDNDVAKAIVDLQTNYVSLGLSGPITIACISQFDGTRPNKAATGEDGILTKQFCTKFLNQVMWLNVAGVVAKIRTDEAQAKIRKLTEIPPFPTQ